MSPPTPYSTITPPAAEADSPNPSTMRAGTKASVPKARAPSTATTVSTQRTLGIRSSAAVLARYADSENAGGTALPAAGAGVLAAMARACRHSRLAAVKNSSDSTTNAARQPSASTAKPPNHCPAIIPDTVATISCARVSCRCSYGTLSPIHAIDSGMMPAADAPMAARAATSTGSVGASAVTPLKSAQANVAPITTRTLPSRSPRGP